MAVLGKFDAKNDQTIFVRDGIVNFPALIKVFDFMANFYSLRGATAETNQLFDDFLKTCAPGSESLGWREILEQKPNCQALLAETVQSFAEFHEPSESRMSEPVGKYLPALISLIITETHLTSFEESFVRDVTNWP